MCRGKRRFSPTTANGRSTTTNSDDLDFDAVLERFYTDLDARGVEFERPTEPLTDPAFIDVLAGAYVQEPSVFESA